MRSLLASAVLVAFAGLMAIPETALAQRRNPDDETASQRRRRGGDQDREIQAPLPGVGAVGACPYVKVLYDAARYVEFKDARVGLGNVAYTGEIEGITARCTYLGENPIDIEVAITFSLGKGPQATDPNKTYGYWVAVTTRNRDVLAKESFGLPVQFPEGQDRVVVSDHIAGITIPRANSTISGANFEILVGFDVTPEMAEFNRDGSRFRVNAAPTTAAVAAPAAATPAASGSAPAQ